MNSLYNTQPPQISSSGSKKQNLQLSRSVDKKNSKSYHKKQSLQQSRIFTQTIQLVGNPQSQYLQRKIKGFAKNLQYISRKRMHTEEKLPNLSSYKKASLQLLNYNSKLSSIQHQGALERAYVLNQSQKIERLVNKHQEQEERYKALSHRLKIKLTPHKQKIPKYESYLKPMQKYTWYRKWSKNDNNEKCRKKWKVLDKMKNQQLKRNNLTQIFIKPKQ